MSQNAWIGVIVAVLVIGAGTWWFTMDSRISNDDNIVGTQQDATPATTDTTSGTGAQAGVDVNVNTAPISATVIYNGDSFAPSSVTIKKGGTVKWVNTSGGTMWVASAQHPTHGVYDGTSRTEHCPNPTGTAFDQCVGGGDYSFTFGKVGTWNYHDHINANLFGKVVVVE